MKRGEPVIRFDLEKVKKLYDTATMVIMTNGKNFVKQQLDAMLIMIQKYLGIFSRNEATKENQ